MLPTSKAHSWDAHQACLAALSFVEGIDVHEFQVNLLVQSAVERQLEILGEALNRLRRTDAQTAAEVPDLDGSSGCATSSPMSMAPWTTRSCGQWWMRDCLLLLPGWRRCSRTNISPENVIIEGYRDRINDANASGR